MTASIVHRVTGGGLAIVGLGILTWWLFALSSGSDAYGTFQAAVSYRFYHIPLMLIVLIGLTWAFFQHLFSGIRHLVMDTGAALEVRTSNTAAVVTFIASVLLTAALWWYLLGVAK